MNTYEYICIVLPRSGRLRTFRCGRPLSIYTYTYIHTYIHIYIYREIHIYKYMYIYTCIVGFHAHSLGSIGLSSISHVFSLYIYIYTYIYTYIHTYIHTHIYIYTHSFGSIADIPFRTSSLHRQRKRIFNSRSHLRNSNMRIDQYILGLVCTACLRDSLGG